MKAAYILIDISHCMIKLPTNNTRQVCTQFREKETVYNHNRTDGNKI